MKKPDPQTKKMLERILRQQEKPVTSRLQPKSRQKNNLSEKQKIDCRNCMYFFITWEKPTPYGCKAHGFKSAQMPSIVVFSNSNQDCLLFQRKPS